MVSCDFPKNIQTILYFVCFFFFFFLFIFVHCIFANFFFLCLLLFYFITDPSCKRNWNLANDTKAPDMLWIWPDYCKVGVQTCPKDIKQT